MARKAKPKIQEKEKPVWLKHSEEDLKKIIKELSDKHQPAQIGLILRDQYGVPTIKLYGKKLTKYLEELGINTKTLELKNVEKKTENLREHLKKHGQDKRAKHKLQKSQSHVEVLKRYYSKK